MTTYILHKYESIPTDIGGIAIQCTTSECKTHGEALAQGRNFEKQNPNNSFWIAEVIAEGKTA